MQKNCKYCGVSLMETPNKSVCFDCKTERRRAVAIKYAKNRGGLKGVLKNMLKKITKAEKKIASVIKEGTEERAMKIMELRFEQKKTLQEIGAVFGISRERVRQIISKLTPDGGSGFVSARKKEITCKECGSIFNFNWRKSKLFCSAECRSKNLATKRLEALKHCVVCGGTKHLIPVKTSEGVPYQARCTECSTERAKRYRHASVERMKASYIRAKRSYHKNIERSRVPMRFTYYKKQYGIKPPLKCSGCGEEKKLIAHHVDYSKALLVAWLCHRCHKRVHDKNVEVPKEYLHDYSYLVRRRFLGRRRPKT